MCPECLYHPLIDSTNLEARRQWPARSECGEPFVVVAGEQSGGMGRQGRAWHSPRGGLWLSYAWPARKPLGYYEALPLVAGLAVCETLESLYGLTCGVKWPNDILVRDRKICGIMCQSEAGSARPCVIAGIGINGNFTADVLGEGLRHPPTTLADELSRGVDLDELRVALVGRLTLLFEDYEERQLAAMLPRLRARLAWLGGQVNAHGASGSEAVAGRLAGIDERGRLLLETGGGVRAFATGELEKMAREGFDPPALA